MSDPAINKSFVEVFPELELGGEVLDFFKEVNITSLGVFKKSGKLVAKATAARLIPAALAMQVEQALAAAFSLTVEIKLRFELDIPFEEMLAAY